MKTHDLARYLEQLAHLLRQLPDTDLDSSQIPIIGQLPLEPSQERKEPAKPPRQLPADIVQRLSEMAPAAIEELLLSDSEGFTVANLTDLAERIGLSSSKRQSKSALVNMITRHYEATKLHSIMRGSGPNEA